MESSQIAICLLTNESNHLEEWLKHHRNYGFSNFLIYCDGFQYIEHKARHTQRAFFFKANSTKSHRYQMEVYEDCCKKTANDYEYLLIIDSDEYYESKTGNIHEDIKFLKEKYGEFDGLGISWRMYGKSEPYFETRQPIESYIQWYPNEHIKSLIKPSKVMRWFDPHKPILKSNSIFINELGQKINSPIEKHTSEHMWIKHIWSRSLEEWKEKVNRKGWYEFYDRKMEQFYEHNNQCK